jgi:hypothetical protein
MMVTCCSTHNQTVDVVPHTLPDCVHSVSANPREEFRFPEFVYQPVLIKKKHTLGTRALTILRQKSRKLHAEFGPKERAAHNHQKTYVS